MTTPSGNRYGWYIDVVDGKEVLPGGDVGGDMQLSESWSVRLRTTNTPYAVIDLYHYAAPADESKFAIQTMTTYTICSDPADVGGSEEWSETSYDDGAVIYDTLEEATFAAMRAAEATDASYYTWRPWDADVDGHGALKEITEKAVMPQEESAEHPRPIRDDDELVAIKPDGTTATAEEFIKAFVAAGAARDHQMQCPRDDCDGRIEASAPFWIGISTDGTPYLDGIGWHEGGRITCSQGDATHVPDELFNQLTGVVGEYCRTVERLLGAEMGEDQVEKRHGG